MSHLTDGSEWKGKQHSYPSFFKDPRNVLILLCADGATVWKDMSGVFPIYFQVLNLPPEIRKKFANLELWGMMAGKPKNTTILYEKLVDELLELWEVGFPCWDSFTDEIFRLRAMLFATVFDYQGLVDAMNIKGVGSYSACAKCMIRGKGRCQHLKKMLYKFSEQDPPGTCPRKIPRRYLLCLMNVFLTSYYIRVQGLHYRRPTSSFDARVNDI